jgi:ferritin-like metal-binding protein YciE
VRTNTATLRDLWMGDLKTLSSLQRQIARALPRCIAAAVSDDLRRAFEEQLAHHHEQAARLRRVFETLRMDGRGAFNRSAHSLLADVNGAIRRRLPAQLSDVATIAAVQRIHHQAIAAYGTARAYAELLGETNAMHLLDQTLGEVKAADRLLTEIARDIVARPRLLQPNRR